MLSNIGVTVNNFSVVSVVFVKVAGLAKLQSYKLAISLIVL
jgi:hypothetical protein